LFNLFINTDIFIQQIETNKKPPIEGGS